MEKKRICRKPIKKAAKNVFKAHYWILVAGCIFAAIFGAGASDGFFSFWNIIIFFPIR